MRVEWGGEWVAIWITDGLWTDQNKKKAAPGVVVVEEEEGGGGEGWEIESMEGGERCRGGGEVRRGERELDFLGVQSRAARLVVSIRAGLEMASSSSSSSSSKLQLFTHRWKESLVYHRRAGVAWNSYQMMLRQARLLLTHTDTHTPLLLLLLLYWRHTPPKSSAWIWMFICCMISSSWAPDRLKK